MILIFQITTAILLALVIMALCQWALNEYLRYLHFEMMNKKMKRHFEANFKQGPIIFEFSPDTENEKKEDPIAKFKFELSKMSKNILDEATRNRVVAFIETATDMETLKKYETRVQDILTAQQQPKEN